MTIALAPGETLAASGPTTVRYSLFGDQITGTTDAFKTLAQGSLSVAAATIYASTGVQTVVKTVVMFNSAGTPSTVALYANGTTSAFQIWAAVIPAGGTATYGQDGWRITDATGTTLVTAAAITATGDVSGTQSGSNLPLVLATVATAATTGDASHVAVVTVDVKGRTTTAAAVAIVIPESSVTNLVTDLSGKQPTGNYITALTGDITASGPGSAAATLATVTTAQTVGDASHVAVVTTDVKGRTTGMTSTPIAIANTAVSGLGTLATQNGTFSGTHSGSSSGTNTGDQTLPTLVSLGGVPTSRNVNTTAPLTGGGSLAADLTLSAPNATTSAAGWMVAADKARMGQVIDAQADLGFVGDLITTNSTSSCSTGTPNQITDTASPFTPAGFPASYYVGKRITLAGAGAAGAMYVGTVTAVAAGTATVSPNISTTVTNRICSFGTDNTAAITALNTLINTTRGAYPGTKILYGNSLTNAYGFPIPPLLNQTVQVEGMGGGHTADTGDYSRIGGTRLAWWGTSVDGGVAFGAFWTISPTGVQSIKKPAFRHCWIDCRNGDQNSALIGLKLASCQGWSLDDFFVMDPGAIGIWFDIATSPTEARDCTRGLATNLGFRCLDNTSGPVAVTLTPTTTSSAVSIAASTSLTLAAANGLRASGSDYIWVQSTIGRPFLARYTGGGGTTTLTGVACAAEDAVHVPTTAAGSNVVQASPSNSMAMYLNGGSGANTCCNTFLEVAISHGSAWGPAAIEFGNSDSNDFQSCYINGGTRAVFGAAPNNRMTKPGARQNGSNTSGTLASRNNTFTGGDPGSLPITNGGVELMGLLNTGAIMLAPSGPTYWEKYQLGNGAPMPVVESGASFFWSANGALREGAVGASSTAAQALTAAVGNIVTGSVIMIPPQGWQVGTRLQWRIPIRKTAAGGLAWTAGVRQNSALTAGSGTLIANVAFTSTAAIDAGELVIDLVVTSLGGAGTAVAEYYLSHALAITGLSTGAVTAGTIDLPGATGQHHVRAAMAAFNTTLPASGPAFVWVEINPVTAATAMTIDAPVTPVCLKAANP